MGADEKTRFEAKFVKAESCWLWAAAVGGSGYGHFWFRGRPRPSSQVSHLLYVGEIPAGMCVLHRCDNRLCVRPSHLFLGTNKENVEDKMRKGRQPRGEQSHAAKLTTEDVIAIRADQRSQRVIGAHYGISHTVVGQIKSRAIWRHI
jgi:hypothetical protein